MRELFSTLFDLSPLSMTLEDIKTGKYVKVNKAFEVSSGYSSNEVIGKNSVELNLLPENNGQTLVDLFLEKGEIHNQEINIKTKSGQLRTGLFTTKNIKIDKTKFLLVVTMDITELKQYRKEVGRLDRLDLIGQMAAAISHEVRNPLTVVKGFLQMLMTKSRYLDDNEYFQLMISELDRANSIITDFLSVSRTNNSDFGEYNLNKIIKFVYPLINADALRCEKNISLELNPIPDILLNKEEIKQLVLNLVRNGLEAMPAGGCLTISTFLENEEVVLSVRDEGCGLPQKVLDSLGTPFITTKENGTGLGLTVCLGIVSRHKGKIDVETGSKGTIFSVKFPVRDTHEPYMSLSHFSVAGSQKFGREHGVSSY